MQSTTLAAPKTQQKPPMQASRCPKKAMGGLFCQPDPALRLSISHYVGTLTFNGPAPAARSGTQARRPSWGSGWSSRLNPLRPRDSRIQRRGLLVVDASASGASRPLRTYLPTDYVQAYYLLGPSPSRLPPSPIIQMHPSTDLAPRIVPQPLLSCRGSMPWRPANSI